VGSHLQAGKPPEYATIHLVNSAWVSRNQKGKPFWILLEQEMMGWQSHQLDHIHMQIICTSLQPDNHASTSPQNWFKLQLKPLMTEVCQS